VLFRNRRRTCALRRPTGGDDVECEATVADVIDVRGLLGEKSGLVKCGADGDHELDPFGDGGESRRR